MCCSPSDAQQSNDQAPPTPSHEALCKAVVYELQVGFGWLLVDEDELVRLTLAAAPAAPDRASLSYVARDQYSRALWEASRAGAAPARREQAYAELQRYLFRAAYNRRPELAEECVQRALELIVAQVEHCHEPGAFLTFALYKLRQALSEEAVRAARGAPAEPPPEQATAADAVSAAAEGREREMTLIAAIGRLPDRRQRETLVLRFYGGLDDQTIGARLAITPNLVRVLRHRALTRLRRDKALLALLVAEP